MSKLLDDVVSELSRLPGVGRRTAMRLAMHMLRMEEHGNDACFGKFRDR